jgi:hypothetical protein
MIYSPKGFYQVRGFYGLLGENAFFSPQRIEAYSKALRKGWQPGNLPTMPGSSGPKRWPCKFWRMSDNKKRVPGSPPRWNLFGRKIICFNKVYNVTSGGE